MEYIHRQFGLQQEQCEDDASLVNYLLKAAPLYTRLCSGDISVTDEDIQECLGFAMPGKSDTANSPLRTELTPFGCPCSKRAHVCVDTELACLRCMTCGRMTGTGYVRPSTFQDLSLCSNTSLPYTYQPKSYLGKLLRYLQGRNAPRFRAEVLPAVCDDLTSHGILLSAAMPNDVYDALKRLKLGKLYPHRWALTKLVNPTYQPLSLPDALCERMEHVFRISYKQYVSQRARPGHKCKFLSYHLFIRYALQYFGVKDVGVHFKPMKNKTIARHHMSDLERLLPLLWKEKVVARRYTCDMEGLMALPLKKKVFTHHRL